MGIFFNKQQVSSDPPSPNLDSKINFCPSQLIMFCKCCEAKICPPSTKHYCNQCNYIYEAMKSK